jgi:hypothetical protein
MSDAAGARPAPRRGAAGEAMIWGDADAYA